MGSTVRTLDQNPHHLYKPAIHKFGDNIEIYDRLKSVGTYIDHEAHFFLDAKLTHEHTFSTPSKKLYRAILFQALNDIFRPYAWVRNGLSQFHSHKLRHLQKDALRWVLDDSEWERSFNNLCAHLDLDAEYLRKKIIDQIYVYKKEISKTNTRRLLLKKNSPKRANVIRIKQ